MGMSTNVRKQVRASMSDFVSQKNEGTEHYRLEDAHKEWVAENPDLFAAFQDDAARDGTRRLLKQVIDSQTMQAKIAHAHAQQLELTGLDHLPRSFAVPDESGEGNVYVPSMQMTIPLLVRHRDLRVNNLAAAQKSLDDFDRMVDQLRPFMLTEDVTIEEALDTMGIQEAN